VLDTVIWERWGAGVSASCGRQKNFLPFKQLSTAEPTGW